MTPVGTRPPALITAFLSLHPDRIRDWKRRGLIGPSCDVKTHQEGYDVLALTILSIQLAKTRPRQTVDETAWRSHAVRVASL